MPRMRVIHKLIAKRIVALIFGKAGSGINGLDNELGTRNSARRHRDADAVGWVHGNAA